MEKIIQYKVVYFDKVDEHLKEGWELYGPPLIANNLFFQAVIKREEKK